MSEYPHLVEPKIPRGGNDGRNNFSNAVGHAPEVERVHYDVDGHHIENHERQILEEANVAAVLGAERKRTLKHEIEDQTRDEGQRRCDPQVDSEQLVQQYEQAKIDDERSASHQEKLDQVAALDDANKFGTELLGAVPEPTRPVGCLQAAPRRRWLDSYLPSLGNCTRTTFLLMASCSRGPLREPFLVVHESPVAQDRFVPW